MLGLLDLGDEAEAISRMTAAQAGKAIAKLEARFSADAAKAKPKASSAPLESLSQAKDKRRRSSGLAAARAAHGEMLLFFKLMPTYDPNARMFFRVLPVVMGGHRTHFPR